MHHQPKIIFDAERMKYRNTGLYYYCMHLGKALLQQQPAHNAKLGFYVKREESSIFKHADFFYFQNSLQKHYMLLANKFDVWHCSFQGSNYFPYRSKNKIVLTVHDLNFLHENVADEVRKKKQLSIQKKINRADSIITISEFVKNEMLNNFRFNNKPVNVIYNGCNINNAITPTIPAFQPKQPFLFTVSVIEEKKNIHVLPNLLLNNDYFLIISGAVTNEPYKNKVLKAAQQLKVQDRVIFTGAISEAEKYWYLQNCTAFVFASSAEGFGLPVIEAMHFGKPAILSKATSLPEVGGPHAYYFNSFNADDMCNVLENSLKDYTQSNKSIEIKKWSAKFNWQNAATQHWKIYQDVLSGN